MVQATTTKHIGAIFMFRIYDCIFFTIVTSDYCFTVIAVYPFDRVPDYCETSKRHMEDSAERHKDIQSRTKPPQW